MSVVSYEDGIRQGLRIAIKEASAVQLDYHGTMDETPIDSFTVWRIVSRLEQELDRKTNA